MIDYITSFFKRGYKTTEFYTTIASAAVALLAKVFGWDLDAESIVAIVGANASYVIGRSYLKGKRVQAVQEVAAETVAQRLAEQYQRQTPPVGP